jgi:hypothetical protein
MKTKLKCLMLIIFSAMAARSEVVVTFDTPVQTATPGVSLAFTATISNSGVGTVFLNGDALNLEGTGFTVNDLFFDNAPLSLAGGDSFHGELFDVLINADFADAFGGFAGTYNLAGGGDGDAQDTLLPEAATFEVIVTPEPSSFALMTLAAIAGCILRARARPGWLLKPGANKLPLN